MNKIEPGTICIVIERSIIAGEGLCDDCLEHGMASRWAIVRRYIVPAGTKFDKFFGIGEGSIQPKVFPDNASTGTLDFMRTMFGKVTIEDWNILRAFPAPPDTNGIKVAVATVATLDSLIALVGKQYRELSTDIDAMCEDRFELESEWHDSTPPTEYRIVAWRVAERELSSELNKPGQPDRED